MTAVLNQTRSLGMLLAQAGRSLLTAFAAVLFALGWSAAAIVGALWLVLSWSAAAVMVGWHEARAPRRSGEG